MFDSIKKFFSGIVAFFTGFFSPKKSQDNSSEAPKVKKGGGYYMQLEEAAETNLAAASQSAKSHSQAEAKKPEPVAAHSEKTTAKPASSTNGATSQPDQPQVRVELVQVAEGLKAVPAKPESSNNGKIKPQSTTTFAPNYLIGTPSSRSRRRPGPSMDTFRNMARDVKTPS